MQNVHPSAGQPASPAILVNIPKLISAYYLEVPDVSLPEQRVKFGTSGHRGSSFERNFNETHILAITQAICDYRKQQKIFGPLFLGMDTHALSIPALASTLEVLAANQIDVMLSEQDEYTPSPVLSHAILGYNRLHKDKVADGIGITPSHNPPPEGGFKYDPPNGGPADPSITRWIENRANEYIQKGLSGVKRIPYQKALVSSTTHRYNYVTSYIDDLINVIDMEAIRDSKISMGVDPLGGAGVHYWKLIAEKYGINLQLFNETVDPTFSFMTVDWDGQIRMDPSSPYAMTKLIGMRDKTTIAFACDTDYDRHGIVTKQFGLLPSNHYLSVAISYLFTHRPQWRKNAGVGKTLVSSQMIDFVSEKLGRKVFEVPVGFKWFVDGLIDGALAFVGEESAGATFARKDGSVWTTDKDGFIACLLAAEITAKMGKDPGELYETLTNEFGKSYFERVESTATTEQKEIIKSLTPAQVHLTTLAGEKIKSIFNMAPGNGQPIGGIKVVAQTGWFAARPSGTEDIYRIYAESFRGKEQMNQIIEEAKSVLNEAFKTALLSTKL